VTFGTGVEASAAKVDDEIPIPPRVTEVIAVLRPSTVVVVVRTVGVLMISFYL